MAPYRQSEDLIRGSVDMGTQGNSSSGHPADYTSTDISSTSHVDYSTKKIHRGGSQGE